MQVTTTARRKYLLIDSGTSADRAKVYGDTRYAGKVACTLGGTPYAGDTKAKPPCGVEYLHSTADSGPYKLQTTVVWEVTWAQNGRDMGLVTEDPYVSVRQPPTSVTVREVQTTVSGAH